MSRPPEYECKPTGRGKSYEWRDQGAREYVAPKVAAARKRIEDIKLAKELGIPLEELCRT